MADNGTENNNTALSIIYQVILALGTILIFIVLYELIRATEFGKKIYAPKLFLLPNQTPEIAENWFGWLKKNSKIDEDYILYNNGLDAVMCLKIYKMGFKIFITIFIVVGILTIPVNVYCRDKSVDNSKKNSTVTSNTNSTTQNIVILNHLINTNNITWQEEKLVENINKMDNPKSKRENNININNNSNISNISLNNFKRNEDENVNANVNVYENLVKEEMESFEKSINNNNMGVDVKFEVNDIIKTLKNLKFNNETNANSNSGNVINRMISENEMAEILGQNVKFIVKANEKGENNNDTIIDQATNIFNNTKSTLEEFNIKDIFFDKFKNDKKKFAYFHVVAVYFVVIYICYVLYKTYQEYLEILEKYLREDGIIQERNISGEILQHNTIMIRNIPSELQDDEKLTNWFNKLGIGKIENVVIARSRNTIKKEIEKRNQILSNYENAYIQWIENIKNKNENDSFITRILKNFVKEDDTDIMKKLYKEENDRYRPRHVVKMYGIIPIKYVDSIYYYENELMKITDEICDLRYEASESKKWSQTAFITYDSQQSAKIASQIILYSSQNPNVMACKCAPHPNDLIYSNLTRHTQQKSIRTFLVYIAMYFVCFAFVSLVTTTNYGMVRNWSKNYIGIREVFEYIDTNHYLKPLFESLFQIVLINAYMSLVPYILRFLSNFQGFESKSEFATSILKKYYVFLLVNVLFTFTISSIPEKTLDFNSLKDEAMNINLNEVISRITSEFNEKSVDYLNYGILRLQSYGFELFRIGPIIMGFIGLLFKKKDPRQIHQKNHETTPPDYSIILAVPMLCYTLFIVFSVINPFIALVGFIYFYLGYHIMKNQFIYVYIKEYEAQGHYFITTFNRIIFSLFLFEVFMIGFFLMNFSAESPYAYLIFPTPLITMYFYKYCHKCFKPRTDNVPADLLISKNQGKMYTNTYKRTNIFGRSESISSFSLSSGVEESFMSCASHVTNIEDKSPSEILKYSESQVNDLPPYYVAKSYYNPALTECLYSPWIPEEANKVLSKEAINHITKVCKKCIKCDKDSKSE